MCEFSLPISKLFVIYYNHENSSNRLFEIFIRNRSKNPNHERALLLMMTVTCKSAKENICLRIFMNLSYMDCKRYS